MKRNVALDLLKLLLAFFVVGQHASFFADINPSAEYLAVNGLFRIAVPIFLLINGFFFYPAIIRGDSFAWIRKIIKLYVFWSIVYSFFWFKPYGFSSAGTYEIFLKIIFGYFHLWYLSGIIGAGLLMYSVRNVSSPPLVVLIVITYGIGVTIQYAGYYHLVASHSIDNYFNSFLVHRNFLLFSFPFFCLGFLMKKFNVVDKTPMAWAVTASLIGISLLLGESYFNLINSHRDTGFDNFASLIFVCPFIFIVFMKADVRGTSKHLASYATGIFLVHGIFLILFSRYTVLYATSLTCAVIAASAVASFFLIKMNNRLKFVL